MRARRRVRRGGRENGNLSLSGDRHEPSYGDSPAYNRYFVNQLTELLSDYGEIAEVWFDGACGEGPEYDWQAYWFADANRTPLSPSVGPKSDGSATKKATPTKPNGASRRPIRRFTGVRPLRSGGLQSVRCLFVLGGFGMPAKRTA